MNTCEDGVDLTRGILYPVVHCFTSVHLPPSRSKGARRNRILPIQIPHFKDSRGKPAHPQEDHGIALMHHQEDAGIAPTHPQENTGIVVMHP
ncbi:conserved hypothetical protein [Ricinus communis]|uniref:Uncharacterized protein n=1 Tax=Ricinus communis TaxID=3988 RepID=B9RPL1_RICCO|nr:conserved hypothetical protein [Ricinus communis]